ncbi:MAG: hypothetical protein KGL39_00465 [Patescibacteria group bacterium]|nr:hypothetical protein [Patescibacteria group bacterium]
MYEMVIACLRMLSDTELEKLRTLLYEERDRRLRLMDFPSLTEEELRIAHTRKYTATQLYRTRTGLGLLESKAAIEQALSSS